MAHFVEHILFKGTLRRDAWHINNRMESVGGELNAFTTKEETTFYAIGLNKDFSRAADLLCDLLFCPTAPQHELEKEQEVVIDEIMSYRDTPSELVFDEFENQLFTGQPLGHNILGNARTVRSFDHDKCMDFINEHYRPERMVFFHQGSTPFGQVVRTIEKLTDGLIDTKTESAPIHYASSMTTKDNVKDEDSSSNLPEPSPRYQSHVVLGTRTYPIGHPYAATMALLNNILGGPGMNSRLGLALREHRGLVYTVDSSLTSYTDTGYMGIYFGCDHHDVDKCLRLCRHELARLCDHPLTAISLAKAQKQLCGQLGVASANLESNAIAMAKNLLRLGRVERLDETYQRVMAVTPELIHRVANEVFNPEVLKTVIIK